MEWLSLRQRAELATTSQQLLAFLNAVQAEANQYNRMNIIHLFISADRSSWCLAVTSGVRPMTCDTRLHFTPPYNTIRLSGFTALSTLTFYGRRNTAQTNTFRLTNDVGQVWVIVSKQGRIRYCRQNSYIIGIPRC